MSAKEPNEMRRGWARYNVARWMCPADAGHLPTPDNFTSKRGGWSLIIFVRSPVIFCCNQCLRWIKHGVRVLSEVRRRWRSRHYIIIEAILLNLASAASLALRHENFAVDVRHLSTTIMAYLRVVIRNSFQPLYRQSNKIFQKKYSAYYQTVNMLGTVAPKQWK